MKHIVKLKFIAANRADQINCSLRFRHGRQSRTIGVHLAVSNIEMNLQIYHHLYLLGRKTFAESALTVKN